jgi:CheY-like chemotaxis protein
MQVTHAHTIRMPSSRTLRQLPRILVIDDDAISREVVAMMLEIHSFAVETAESGEAALALLDSQDLDRTEVVLMDLQMPGLSGTDLIDALRARSAARIYAISASEPTEAMRGIADGFLLKPVEMDGLVALLQPDADELDGAELAPTPLAGAGSGADVTNPAIDAAVLGKLLAMMPATAVREIYTAVASDLKTRLIKLQSAMTSSDVPEVKRLAHSIKGGCSMVGLTGATEAAARLETSNMAVTYPEELSQLHAALAALDGILEGKFPA